VQSRRFALLAPEAVTVWLPAEPAIKTELAPEMSAEKVLTTRLGIVTLLAPEHSMCRELPLKA
jgi:hypothetical protein